MEGFYTKEQAAEILGVSMRQVQKYMSQKHLRVVYSGHRAWLPKEDVQSLYDKAIYGKTAGPDEIVDLQGRVKSLEETIDVLKLSLGYGAKKKLRTEVELMLLRQKFLDLLGRTEWPRKQLAGIADDLISIQEPELLMMTSHFGVGAWLPLHQLTDKMLVYLEGHEDFPTGGLDVLQARLLRAKERFLGLIYATAKVPSKTILKSAQLHEAMTTPSGMDKLVLDYILAGQ